MRGGTKANCRFAPIGEPALAGGVRTAHARDRVLGRPCVLRFAPVDAPEAAALRDEAALLADLDHPGLSEFLHAFHEARPGHVEGEQEPVVGFAMSWRDGSTLLDALVDADRALRRDAFLQLLDTLAYLHRRGQHHGALSPGVLQLQGRRVRLLPLRLDAVPRLWRRPDEGPVADVHAAGRVGLEVLLDPSPAVQAVLEEMIGDDPPVDAEATLVRLGEAGLSGPRHLGAPPMVDLDRAARALEASSASAIRRPVAVVAPPGSGRTRLARRALIRLALEERRTVLDLSRTPAPLMALHRCLLPPRSTPAFDDGWLAEATEAIQAQGWAFPVFLGRHEALADRERTILQALARAMAAAGAPVFLAAPAPPEGFASVPVAALDVGAADDLAAYCGARDPRQVRTAHALSRGRPGPLLQRLAVISGASPLPGEARAALARLEGLPPAIPSRIIARLPSALREQLPVLVRTGYAHFDDDGALHVTRLRSEAPLDPRIAHMLQRGLLDPLGETDPLWRARAWIRLGNTERAASLLDEVLRTGDRREGLREVVIALAREGCPAALVEHARTALDEGRAHDALVALDHLQQPGDAALLLRATALRRTGRSGAARALVEDRLGGDPGAAWWLERARLDLHDDDPLAAEQALQRAREAGAEASLLLGPAIRAAVLRRQLGLALADEAALVALAREHPPPPPVALELSDLLAEGDPRAAARLLEEAAARCDASHAPDLAVLARAHLGDLHDRLRHDARARQAWQLALIGAIALGRRRSERRARYALARQDLRHGRLDAAEAHLAALPESPWGDVLAAECALARGAPQQALDHLPTSPPQGAPDLAVAVALPRIEALLETGDPGAARPWLDCLGPDLPRRQARRAHLLRGRVHLALGRQALDAARAALPESPEPGDELEAGRVLLAWGGEDRDPDTRSDRIRTLEQAAQLLDGAEARRAKALADQLLRGVEVPDERDETPTPQVEPRDVLGILLTDHSAAAGIETTLELLDPSRSNNLLITGPTGAGKRVFAERLATDKLGLDGLEEVVLRQGDPQMLVSLLFGTRKGEFTGALDQEGAVQRALRGRRALLLDEVHTLDRTGQEILLPLLELPRRRIGGLMRSARDLDEPLQVLLATNVDLSGARWRERFRSDLWFRMSQLHVHLPPLADRGSEAIYRYLQQMLAESGWTDPDEVLDPPALHALLAHPWEGNLRELHTVAVRLARFRRLYDRRITADDLPQFAVGPDVEAPVPTLGSGDVLEMLEINAVLEALRRCDWNQTAAAGRLAISKYRLHRILQKHDLIEYVAEQRHRASG